MTGRNIAKWLDEFIAGPADLRKIAASKLMKISEYYFDDHKVTPEVRKSIVIRISTLLSSPEPIVHECIASLLGNLQVWTVEVKNILDCLLSNESESVLINSVWAAASLKSNAQTLVPKILTLQNHNSREVRFRLAYALKEIGLSDQNVRMALLKLANDADWLVRMYAFEALSVCISIPDKHVERVLIRALDDSDQAVRAGACRAIGILKVTSKAAKRKLTLMAPEIRDALWALSNNWPELLHERDFRKLLEANIGYYWVDELLANTQPIVDAEKNWFSKLFSQ